MNKFIKVITFILTLIICVSLITACNKNEDTSEDNSNVVVSTTPATAEIAVSKMESLGYDVRLIIGDGLLTDGAVSGFRAWNSVDGMMAFWFENEEEAQAYLNGWNDSKYTVKKRDGLCIYYGTEQAIKDFKS